MISWKITTAPADLAHARDIRYRVFVLEQRVPLVLEVDARDLEPTTCHVVGFAAGEPIATGRVLLDGQRANVCHVGRVAVDAAYRGRGIGAQLMGALHEAARTITPRTSGPRIAQLSAQEYATPFYARLGYQLTGAPGYYDAGIWHLDMAMPLD